MSVAFFDAGSRVRCPTAMRGIARRKRNGPFSKGGALAQLGAHNTGSVGVTSSSLVCSNRLRLLRKPNKDSTSEQFGVLLYLPEVSKCRCRPAVRSMSIDFLEGGKFWQFNSITFPEFLNEGRDKMVRQ